MENKVISEITRAALKDLEAPVLATITDIQHLSSYNWIEAPKATPTIAVPGSPDLWSPPTTAFRLAKDTNHIYIAQNAARHPESPLEPLFRALYISKPDFDINSVDVVTDRNNIRKLLGFINPRWSGYKSEDFTIEVEVTGNTAIFCRKETKTEETIGPYEFRGYGHSFEEKCTRPEVKGSTGHHRIISYGFGGMKLIVRYETDGYVAGDGTKITQLPTSEKVSQVKDLSDALDSLALSLESSQSKAPTSTSSKLVVKKEGQVVPMSSTLEVKTRVSHKPLAIEDVVVQLWASQTPKLVRAYHVKGTFGVPKVEDVADQIKAWEGNNQRDLRILAALIRKIRNAVRDGGGRAVLKYNSLRDKLVFYKYNGDEALPKDLYAKWGENDEEIARQNGVDSGKVGNSANDKVPVIAIKELGKSTAA